jgi:hypothetical protein
MFTCGGNPMNLDTEVLSPTWRFAASRLWCRLFAAAAGFLAGSVLPAIVVADAQPASRKRPPNCVIIVADDLGYADLGCQGCKDVPTPNIDTLAAGGVRFTNGYVSCPVCSPTRAGLQTGRYQQRFGHELNPGPPDRADPNFGLSLEEVTLADRLKKAGYVGSDEIRQFIHFHYAEVRLFCRERVGSYFRVGSRYP